MRLQLASDLHLEMLRRLAPEERLVRDAERIDVLVLAGDIAQADDVRRLFEASRASRVLAVPGNHEYYDSVYEEARAARRATVPGSKVEILDDRCTVIDGVRFIGSTLWSDFLIDPARPRADAMREVEQVLADYRFIETRSGGLTAARTLAEHERSRGWLQARLDEPFGGPTVVITHHGPHPASIHPRYAGNPVNGGFVSRSCTAGTCPTSRSSRGRPRRSPRASDPS